MLKLKKLQILGFKSFCDRTELRFPGDGVAAIIGPNGCGKSNIADSIAWVLGEQSAKTLRGSRMEDVIFAGTRDRKAQGMAEVSLTLIDPTEYDGPVAVDEIELDIRDEMPRPINEDWDEASSRSESEAEAEAYLAEVQPGQREEIEVHVPAGTAASSAESTEEDVPEQVQSIPAVAVAPVSVAHTSEPSVVLKIRRRKFQQKFHRGEIVVTRRLFRSGDSEYLLNGKLCRLRDVHELFMGTGLGPESYAIIEQGRIGQILSSRPTDRRAILEEAAGVTRFKTKKRLAEARLEDARTNLNRVNDIFEEVTKQMNSLKRQSAKAERYGRLRDEMRGKLRVVLASRFAELEAQRTELQQQIQALGAAIEEQTHQVAALDGEHAERSQRGYDVAEEVKQSRERIGTIAREVDRAQSQQRFNTERAEELGKRAEAAENEKVGTAARLIELEQEVAENRGVLESATTELAAAQQQFSAAQQEAAQASGALSQLERQQQDQQRDVMGSINEASNLRNQITQIEERAAALERDAQRILAEIAAAEAQIAMFGGQRGQQALDFESAGQKVNRLIAEIGETRATLTGKRNEETAGKQRLDSLRSEYATFLGRKSSLESVIAEHGYSTESVRRLFQSGQMQGGLAPAGVLADFLEVDAAHEHVVEDFLRDELNYIVVKSWDAANEGLRLLRTGVDGRATFLVHPNDSQAKFSFAADDSVQRNPSPANATPLKDCVKVLDGFGRSLEVILPKLRDGYLVPDPIAARVLALENPGSYFLADSGECFHNVTVTGGRQRSEGPLSLKRELREVNRQIADVEVALRDEESGVMRLGREIAELSALLQQREGERMDAEKLAMTSGHALKQLDAEMARIRERQELSQREVSRIEATRNDQLQMLEGRRSALATADERRNALEGNMATSQADLITLRERRDTAAQAVASQGASVATLQERHRSAAAQLGRIEALAQETTARAFALEQQIDSARAEKAQRLNDNEQIALRIVELEAEGEAAQSRELALQTEATSLRARLAEIEDLLKQQRAQLDQARDHRGELAASAAKLDSDAQHMAETCLAELTIERDVLMAEPLARLAGDELAAEDAAYRQLRTQLDNMGPVNMMALEEYNEAAERHSFLETQRKDLIDAIENTVATIKEIDLISREKFKEAFDKVNENFQVTFRKLFGGGQAYMKLTDEENASESGIDIVASPPGKRSQNVLLLSGGEKALTALALLVGIFQYQPSPFCILDEVDAPLDEANVGRFNQLVQEMSLKTQFILITHSKKTMSSAPVLYGVTMQEPGVSKLVSVRFGDDAPVRATA